ncbi:MAG: hypothetical protein N7Q72_05295, partial [Spiroplasma sp. Tabriz.8]|nr:hypothetical protein [Spiroplasma sp. Tabriz.8]
VRHILYKELLCLLDRIGMLFFPEKSNYSKFYLIVWHQSLWIYIYIYIYIYNKWVLNWEIINNLERVEEKYTKYLTN